MSESSGKSGHANAPEGGRRNGSILAALICVALLIAAAVYLYRGTVPTLQGPERPIDSIVIGLFVVVLLWWVISPPGAGSRGKWQVFITGRNWGIGIPTITMVVTVVTAVVAIVTLVHEFFKNT